MSSKGCVVITGVSSGIGWGISSELISRGYRVFGGVRKPEDADRLREEWGEPFTPLLLDVTEPDQVQSAAAQVREVLGHQPLTALINNAGISQMGPLERLPLDCYRRLFEVNVIGLVAVTQAFLPLLKARPEVRGKPGRIINISSIYGVLSHPLTSPYTASKHAVDGLTDCLRIELLDDGIAVILVAPGPVRSRIWEKNQQQDLSYVEGTRYEQPMRDMAAFQEKAKSYGMSERQFGRRVRRILERKRPRHRYTICVMPLFLWVLPRIVPTRLLDFVVARQAGLLSRGS